MVLNILCLVVLLSLSEGQHTHSHMSSNPVGKEEYVVTFETGGINPTSWNMPINHPVIQDIENYTKTISKVQPGTNAAGYRGFSISHKFGGVTQHIWKIPKCGKKELEEKLFYTASVNIQQQIQKIFKDGIAICSPTPA